MKLENSKMNVTKESQMKGKIGNKKLRKKLLELNRKIRL
jgi:hypothetical protein